MHWSLLIVIAGIINACVNFGYKIKSAQDNIFLMSACVMGVASLCLFGFHAYTKNGIRISDIADGNTPFVAIGMGIGSALILYLFVSALAKGPYSIIDPMLACVYTLVSITLGLLILREAPGLTAFLGVGLYLAGAILMAQAQAK